MSTTDDYVAEIGELVERHDHILDQWIRHRCASETDLDAVKLKSSCRGFILWCAVADIEIAEMLAQRSWRGLQELVEDFLASSVSAAAKAPTQGAARTPTLLAEAFGTISCLARVSAAIEDSIGPGAAIAGPNLLDGLQTGLVVLGDTEAEAIDRSMQETLGVIAFIVASDAAKGGAQPPSMAPARVPPLALFTGQLLRGKVLHRRVDQQRAQLVNDYTGGSLVSQVSQSLELHTDNSFRFEVAAFSAVVGTGLGSEHKRVMSGSWAIGVKGRTPHLTLRADGDVVASWASESDGTRAHQLDGERWTMSEIP